MDEGPRSVADIVPKSIQQENIDDRPAKKPASTIPDSREQVILIQKGGPCLACGAEPQLKTKSLPNKKKFSLYVYPCQCFNKIDKEREERQIWQKKLKRSQIPPRYYHASLNPTGYSPYEKEAIPICREFIGRINGQIKNMNIDPDPDIPNIGLGFIGDVGVGKTYYICAVLIELLRAGRHCLFCNVPEYYDQLKSSFSENSSIEYSDIIAKVKDPQIVAFDDIGAEYNTQWTVDELCKIINYRYNHNLTTLFTSNIMPDELIDRIGARTVDRLKEMTSVKLIEGKSLRGRK